MAALLALMLVAFSGSTAYQKVPLLVEQRSFGTFEDAAGMVVFPQGWVGIVDRAAHSVQLFKQPGSSPAQIGGYGWQPSAFDRPSAIATDGINLFIADYGNHRVQRFDRTLTFVSALATRDTTDPRARFGYPLGVAVSRFGDLFVLDGENLRVVKFHVSGRFERSFGDAEPPPGRLVAPVALRLGHNDHLLVLERRRILEYDYFGNFVRQIADEHLNDLRAVAPYDSGLAVVTKNRLIFFDEGSPAYHLELSSIITEKPLAEVRDIIIQGDTLWLLTKTSCIVFRLRWR